MGMQNKTGIGYVDATWNLAVGCSKISPGCRSCWAERAAILHYSPKFKTGWQCIGAAGERRIKLSLFPERLLWPLKRRKPLRIAVNLMTDTFHEDMPKDFIAAIYGAAACCPQHTFIIVTKRPHIAELFYDTAFLEGDTDYCIEQLCERAPEAMRKIIMQRAQKAWPLPNVWLLVSAEDQFFFDKRVESLMQIPAAVRGASLEPMLGPIQIDEPFMEAKDQINTAYTFFSRQANAQPPSLQCPRAYNLKDKKLDWIIAGSESGTRRRDAEIDWFHSLQYQCEDYCIPFYLKQINIGDELSRDIAAWPEDLKRREFPKGSL